MIYHKTDNVLMRLSLPYEPVLSEKKPQGCRDVRCQRTLYSWE